MNSLILRWNRQLYAGLGAPLKSHLARLPELGRVILLREGGIEMRPDHRYPSPIGRYGLPLDQPPVFSLPDRPIKALYRQSFADPSESRKWQWNMAASSGVDLAHADQGDIECSRNQSNGRCLVQRSQGSLPVATRLASRRSSVAARGLRAQSSLTAIRSRVRPWALRQMSPIAGRTRRAADVACAPDRIAARDADTGRAQFAMSVHVYGSLRAGQIRTENSKAVRAVICTGGLFHADTAGAACGTLD